MHEGRYAIIQAHAYQHMVRLITYGLSQYLKHQSNDENHCHTWHNVCMILDEKFMAKNRGVLSASRSSHSHLFSIADVRRCGDAGRCEERKLTASYPQCPNTQFCCQKSRDQETIPSFIHFCAPGGENWRRICLIANN